MEVVFNFSGETLRQMATGTCTSLRIQASPVFDLEDQLQRHGERLQQAFWAGSGASAVAEHIRNGITDIESEPHDLHGWAEVVLLVLGGALRVGHQPRDIVAAIAAKFASSDEVSTPVNVVNDDATPTSVALLSDRLDLVRRDMDWKKHQLADAIGTSRQAVTTWYSRQSIGKKSATKICNVSGVRLEWLLSGTGSMF